MAINLRPKPYKAQPPEETVAQIQQALKAVGLPTRLTQRNFMGLHSCTLKLDGSLQDSGLQTDGKGMNAAYAKASAYAECMERIENGLLLADCFAALDALDPPESRGDFRLAPDEVTKSQAALLAELAEPLMALSGSEDRYALSDRLQSFAGDDPLTCLPFTDVFHDREVLVPIEFVRRYTTSNGMCAGNTAEEAILQGLCEIFERYASDRIQWARLTPPDIPRSCFEGTEALLRMEQLERNGRFRAIIKDCSLGLGLPVVGLLLISPEEGLYRFKLGADPSPLTAFERCLTESGQGGEEGLYRSRVPIDLERRKDRDEEAAKRRQSIDHYLNWRSGAGGWPAELFYEAPSWKFTGLFEPQSSDEGDLRHLVSILRQNGADLWIRDNSYLGFPAYHLLVPQMSLLDRLSERRAALVDRIDRLRPTIWHLQKTPSDALSDLAQSLEALHDDIAPRLAFLFRRKFFPWWRPDPQKLAQFDELDLLEAIHRHLGQTEAIKRDLERQATTPESAFKASDLSRWAERNACSLRLAGQSEAQIEAILSKAYSPAVLEALRSAQKRDPLAAFPGLSPESCCPELKGIRDAIHRAQAAFKPAPLPAALKNT